MNLKFAFLIFLLLVFSCENSNEAIPEVPQSIIDKTLSYFEGEVIEKEFGKESGVDSWKIKVQSNQGSIVKFSWMANGQMPIKIEGQSAPFDYEIKPGNNLINYSSAKTIAKGAVKNENITKWELKENEDFIDNWIYSFEFDDNGQTRTVYIDAVNGNILEID